MRLEISIGTEEIFDNLTLASAIINFCESNKEFNFELDAVKVANAILVEMVGED